MSISPQNNSGSGKTELNKRLFKLDQRLSTVYGFIRDGRVFADIGTDHAYLPCYAVLTGKTPSAFACDVKDGPLLHAAATVKKYKLEKQISFVKTYGLINMDKYDFDDIVIAGMGGELICDIIKFSPYLKNPKYNFILQPMLSKDKLREFLFDNGFNIINDVYCVSQGRFYTVINAVYDGQCRSLTPFQSLMGVWDKNNPPKFSKEYALRQVHVLKKRIEGLSVAGKNYDADMELLKELRDFIKS
ncbi:MAG: SAM-dependent methyltransferase [Ruminococcaceae bacterium]|nr:SAM-dependent methyltransferase [Oscillospiraceae bacterium]